MTFPQTIILRYSRLEPEKQRQLQPVIDDYTRWFLSRLRHVTRALDGREWLCADRFTIADISVGYVLLLADELGLLSSFSMEVAAYWARICQRRGFISAKAAQSQMDGAHAGLYPSADPPDGAKSGHDQ